MDIHSAVAFIHQDTSEGRPDPVVDLEAKEETLPLEGTVAPDAPPEDHALPIYMRITASQFSSKHSNAVASTKGRPPYRKGGPS